MNETWFGRLSARSFRARWAQVVVTVFLLVLFRVLIPAKILATAWAVSTLADQSIEAFRFSLIFGFGFGIDY